METKHHLPFLSCHWNHPANTEGWQEFRVGTIVGQWMATETTYDILSIFNSSPGNGHLEDLFQWFEASCKRDRKGLRILEVENIRFKNHLIAKRGFVPVPRTDHVIKLFS